MYNLSGIDLLADQLTTSRILWKPKLFQSEQKRSWQAFKICLEIASKPMLPVKILWLDVKMHDSIVMQKAQSLRISNTSS